MAYQTGTVRGVPALISTIRDFAVANGWTVNRDTKPTESITVGDYETAPFTNGIDTTNDRMSFANGGTYAGTCDDSMIGWVLSNGTNAATVKITDVVDTDTIEYTTTDSDADVQAGFEFGQSVTATKNSIELLMKNGSVYVGFEYYFNVGSDYYNLNVMTATGFDSEVNFSSQPQLLIRSISLYQFNILYHIILNNNRIILLARAESSYQMAYTGRMLPFASPSQHPNPDITIGCSTSYSSRRYSSHDDSDVFGLTEYNLRMPGGSRKASFNYQKTFGYINSSTSIYFNSYFESVVYPLSICASNSSLGSNVREAGRELVGVLDGIYEISGFSTTVESVFSVDDDNYIVWRNGSDLGFRDYFAVRLL